MDNIERMEKVMKKLVAIALVALMLSVSAVGFAVSYCRGDVGGVFAAQIAEAIDCGGARTGAPLPALSWQKGAVTLTQKDIDCFLEGPFLPYVCSEDYIAGIANRLF